MLRELGITKRIATLASAIVLASCQPAASQNLPDIVVKRVDNGAGSTTLQGWNETPGPRATVKKVLIPTNPLFSDARLFYESSTDPNPKSATETILKLNGFTKGRYRASHDADTRFVKAIDGHDNAGVKAYFYDGQLGGEPAKAITYTWSGQVLCGNESFCNIVHVFMAPNAKFEALGGGAVIAVAWLQQDVPSNITSMHRFGALPADQATQKLAQYANTWMVGHIQTHIQIMEMMGQTAAMNQQVMNSMQSYNNALSQCGGWECTFSQNADGLWTATPE